MRRLTGISSIAVAAFFLASAVGGVMVWRGQQALNVQADQLDLAQQQLQVLNQHLKDRETELADAKRQLAAAVDTFDKQSGAAESPGGAPPPAKLALRQSLDIVRRSLRAAAPVDGLNVDVYWCAGGDNQARAAAAAEKLNAVVIAAGHIGDRTLTRVGLKSLPVKARAQRAQSRRDMIFTDPGEESAAADIKTAIGPAAGAFEVVANNLAPTPGYMTAYFCASQ